MKEAVEKVKRGASLVWRGLTDRSALFFLGFPHYEAGIFAKGNSEHRYFYKSFIVSERHIREIVAVMTDGLTEAAVGSSPALRFAIRTSQFRTETFESEELLLRFFNPRRDRLIHLCIVASTPDRSMCAAVEFREFDPGWSSAAFVEGGTYEQSQRLIERLSHVVVDTHQWYSPISNNRGWRWGAVILLVIWLSLLFIIRFWPQSGGSAPNSPNPDTTEGLPILRYLVINLIELAVIFLVFFVRGWMYPKAVFLIGKGIDRHSQLLVVRKLAITGILIPIGFKIWDCFG